VQAQLTSAQLRGLSGIEVAENIPGDQRACHLDLHAGADPASYAMISDGLVGVSAERADRPGVVRLAGTPIVTDSIRVDDEPASMVSIGRDARAFFQGNRYLIEPLVRHVVGLVPRATVFDLYAGVGLFGLSLAAAGAERVIAVEGETVTGADLVRNAAPFGSRVTALRRSVESYLGSLVRNDVADATLIVDPPRTGISKDAIAHIIRLQPSRLVYISCDVATLARDTKSLHDAGYSLIQINGIDLFPNTAHVETIAVLTR
jgi:23S rRNA (uracil1939-C5)-methyltransferase